jgi:hypothetical protein
MAIYEVWYDEAVDKMTIEAHNADDAINSWAMAEVNDEVRPTWTSDLPESFEVYVRVSGDDEADRYVCHYERVLHTSFVRRG